MGTKKVQKRHSELRGSTRPARARRASLIVGHAFACEERSVLLITSPSFLFAFFFRCFLPVFRLFPFASLLCRNASYTCTQTRATHNASHLSSSSIRLCNSHFTDKKKRHPLHSHRTCYCALEGFFFRFCFLAPPCPVLLASFSHPPPGMATLCSVLRAPCSQSPALRTRYSITKANCRSTEPSR